MFLNLRARRRARNSARAGAVFSAAMLMLNVVSLIQADEQAEAATGFLGGVEFRRPADGIAVTGGGSATEFAMVPPQGAACEGSGAGTPAYRWQTYLVAASVDVGSLTYATGPNPVGDAFVSAMFDATAGSAISNKGPAATPLGLISGIPTMSFGAFTPAGTLPAGEYKIGFACTKAGVTDSWWTAQITVVAAASDSPAGITWTVSSNTNNTTTTTTTTTTTIASTTTTAPRSTTTTVPRTTTTSVGATTTTSVGVTSTTIGFTVLPASPVVGSSGSGSIPVTGSSPIPFVVWALLLLVFGRMAVLLARPPRLFPTAAQ